MSKMMYELMICSWISSGKHAHVPCPDVLVVLLIDEFVFVVPLIDVVFAASGMIACGWSHLMVNMVIWLFV